MLLNIPNNNRSQTNCATKETIVPYHEIAQNAKKSPLKLKLYIVTTTPVQRVFFLTAPSHHCCPITRESPSRTKLQCAQLRGVGKNFGTIARSFMINDYQKVNNQKLWNEAEKFDEKWLYWTGVLWIQILQINTTKESFSGYRPAAPIQWYR